MPETFGARLRQQREQKQIALRSIAEQTKISMSLLEGLERDDVSQWPGGIFRRAFVRSYAEQIGLDPTVTASEFLQIYPDPAGVLSGPAEAPAEAPPPTGVRHLIQSAFDVLSPSRRTTVSPVPQTAAADVPPHSQAHERPPVLLPARAEPDLAAAAELCTELGCLTEPLQAGTTLQRVTTMLDAVGVIIWLWDRQRTELRPWLANGYSDQVLARLPGVRRDAQNATATAFRSMETCVVAGTDLLSGAVVIPLMTSFGCVGVLAVEFPNGREQASTVRALATIFAAQLASLLGAMPDYEIVTA
jgi:transcriptional regulator with XRE-family HTH domain